MYEDRNCTIETINRVDIPKILLSKAVSLDPRRITDFVKHRPLPETDSARIKSAVEKITYIWNVFAPYKIFFDSPQLLEAAFEDAEITKQNRGFAETQHLLDIASAEAREAVRQLARL